MRHKCDSRNETYMRCLKMRYTSHCPECNLYCIQQLSLCSSGGCKTRRLQMRCMWHPGGVTGQYLGRDVRTPSPSPARDRILKCTKTEEFSSLNGKKGAEAGFRSRVGGRAYVKCTGWSGVGCEWAEMAEIQKKQNPTSVDRSRPRGHLGCKGGCLEYKRELLGARKWPGSGDA